MSLSNQTYGFAAVAVCALVTMAIRATPFLIFRGDKLPKIVSYLGRKLPESIMVILVIFCIRNVDFLAWPYGIPEIISGIVCGIIMVWRKNSIPAIAVSTVLYMLLTRTIFL